LSKKTKHKVKIGDVYAVPLDTLNQRYGYVRMYHDPDIAVFAVTSSNKILSLDEIKNYPIVMDPFAMRTSIEKGLWPLIGNIPFENEDEAWPGPQKQVSKIRPDVRMVVYKGHFIREEKFGEYDNLPEYKKLTDERLIEEINLNPTLYHHVE
jgi:hypothetical protein